MLFISAMNGLSNMKFQNGKIFISLSFLSAFGLLFVPDTYHIRIVSGYCISFSGSFVRFFMSILASSNSKIRQYHHRIHARAHIGRDNLGCFRLFA